MIFSAADGNCVKDSNAFGNHCFGDYGFLVNMIQPGLNPWSLDSGLGHYPPFTLLLTKVFSGFEVNLGHSVSLSFYLMTILLCGLFPIWHASRRLDVRQKTDNLVFLGLLTLPFLAAMDRGNNAIWAVPILYLALTNILRGNENQSVIFLSIAIALRPQLIFFILLLLCSKKFLTALKTIIVTTGIYVLSFTLYLKEINIQTYKNFIIAIRGYGSGIPEDWPPNLSLARGLKVITNWFSIEAADATIIVVSTAIIILVLFFICLTREPLKVRSASFLLIPLIFLAAPMTWFYYGTFLIIVTALMIKENVMMGDLFKNRSLTYGYVAGVFVTNTVLFIPVLNDHNNLIQYLVPVYWLVFYCYFIVQNLVYFVKVWVYPNVAS